jgi:hypothetical protein
MSDIEATKIQRIPKAPLVKKNPSFWGLIGWEARVFWAGGIGILVAAWSPTFNTDISIYQLSAIINISTICFGLAALLSQEKAYS